MHPKITSKSKELISNGYLALTCDKLKIIDNHNWINIHCYMVHWLVLIPKCFTKGRGNNNLTKVIMDVLKNKGVVEIDISWKFLSCLCIWHQFVIPFFHLSYLFLVIKYFNDFVSISSRFFLLKFRCENFIVQLLVVLWDHISHHQNFGHFLVHLVTFQVLFV